MKQALAITRKELDSYFGSPMALIFVGIFLVIVLFAFFWVSGFFARGIADVRPLFQWMPILLIFLISTLTMRQWSEEQQTGTLEMLLTMPVRLIDLVIGKFLAVLALVGVALLLTLSLPVTAALLGRLDPGPVIGGYLAAILMASAYIAIGLFISSRTDNQIVSLLLTAIVCSGFYLVGSSVVTGYVSTSLSEFLRALGTGSRFESIERGVIDLRDLVYYLSLTGIFLTLNLLSLDAKRWSVGGQLRDYRFNRRLATALIIVNLIVINIPLSRVSAARADLTQSGDYTLSPVTTDLLAGLQEPLLVRGYFSEQNHPLIAPLIPYVEDVLQEYKIAARGKLQLDFVDPIKNPDLETEANQTYGIRPAPLQVTDRGKSSVINAYLSILIRYGDQNTVLNLLDMIDVQNSGSATPDVRFRNLEYDLTSSIQRAVYGFQDIDTVLAGLKQPAQLTLYVTPKTLPDELKTAPTVINTVADKITKQANGRFVFKTVDVSDPNSKVNPQDLQTKYQIEPLSAGFLSPDTFYLHMVVEADGKNEVIFPNGDISEDQIRTSIESALKRLSPGSLHVVGLWTPENRIAQSQDQFGQQQQSIQQYATLNQTLSKNYDLRQIDLSSGAVASDVSALVIVGPQSMTDQERYAVDQFLMRGGSVFVAAGNYQMTVGPDGNLALQPLANGFKDMLASYGVNVQQSLAMDTQNSPFPVPVQRNVGGAVVQEVQAMDYPQFVDVRPDAMDQQSRVVAGLPAVTLNWASPITVDQSKLKGAKVTTLLRTTANAWTSTSTDTQPNFTLYPDTGFPVEGQRGVQMLGVSIEGSFTSFFKGKPLPFDNKTTSTNQNGTANANNSVSSGAPSQPSKTIGATGGYLAQSPDTARLVVVGSSEFLNDTLFDLGRRLGVDRSADSVQLVENSVDWFVEDSALASIRAKGDQTRLLTPLTDAEQSRWEIGNYVFALVALIALGLVWQAHKRSEKPMPLTSPRKHGDIDQSQPVQA